MRICGVTLLFLALLCLGGLAEATTPCEQSLDFASDGSISEWVVCQNGKRMSVASPDAQFLRLEVSLGSDLPTLELNWAPLPSTGDEIEFVGTDEQNQIEIVRTYRQTMNSELSHTVRISALPKASSPYVWLRFAPGPVATTDYGLRTTFADLVYGFKRAYVSQGGQRWSLANVGHQFDRVAVASRHKVVILETSAGLQMLAKSTADAEPDPEELLRTFDFALRPDPEGAASELIYRQQIIALTMQTPNLAAAGYDGLMFVDLWGPLSVLSKWIEAFLIGVSRITGGVGPAIILLAIAIRFVTYPVSLWAARKQHEYSVVAERINPLIADIRDKYKGAEQSERILAVYSENKISPFSGLKGSIGLFVQIPFLLAVFNVTTSSSIFAGESVLWIADLSQADRAFVLPFYIPFLGDSINALPLILGVVNISFADTTSGSSMSARWTPILISMLIVLVFYSFCAAVVLYWLTVNVLQIAERQLQTRFKWLGK